MPLYEYLCTDCDHHFEILQRLGETADGLSCPRCGEAHLEKQFSTFSGNVAGATGAAAQVPAGGCCRGTPT